MIKKYNANIADYGIMTFMFEVIYDRPQDTNRGYMFVSTYTKYLKIIDYLKLYRSCDCFFGCIHYSINIKDRFDVEFLIRRMRIGIGYKILIRSIRRFERETSVKVIVFKDSIRDSKPIELYNSLLVSEYETRLVLHNSHYYIYDGLISNICNDHNMIDDDKFVRSNYEGFMFYDMKIYIDSLTSNIIPYMMSYFICNDDGTSLLINLNIWETVEDLIYSSASSRSLISQSSSNTSSSIS